MFIEKLIKNKIIEDKKFSNSLLLLLLQYYFITTTTTLPVIHGCTVHT
jgi:hypothetical protein